MLNFSQFVIFGFSFLASVSPANGADEPACGLVQRSNNPLAPDARIWRIGDTIIYEEQGGLRRGTDSSSLDIKFTRPDERIILATQSSSGQNVILTRHSRGMGLYRWSDSGSPQLVPILDKELISTDGGIKLISPLIDAVHFNGKLYLLTNFHLLTTTVNELLAGTFQPASERLPECDITNETCWRGIGLFPANQQIVILRGHRSRPSIVDARYAVDASASPTRGIEPSTLLPATLSGYTNLLKPPLVEVNSNSRLLAHTAESLRAHTVTGRDIAHARSDLSDYPIATSFFDYTNLNEAKGAIAYHKMGTYFFRDGKARCRCFDSVKSVLAVTNGVSTTVHGIDEQGHVLSVSIND